MKILVCGGRSFRDKNLLKTVLSKYLHTDPVIIQGECRGADLLAKEFALKNSLRVECYPANWNKFKKAAGPIRNKQMLDEGKPDLVIAFKGGSGTEDMIKRAKIYGIEVVRVD